MKCMKPSNAGARENAADSDILRPAPDEVVKVMQLVWDMFETALDLGDDADRYRLFDTAHALAAVYLPPDWLGSKPIVSYGVSENSQRTRTADLFTLRCTIFP